MCAQREAPGRRPAPEEPEKVPQERLLEGRLLREVVLVAPVAQVRDAPVPAAKYNEEKDRRRPQRAR